VCSSAQAGSGLHQVSLMPSKFGVKTFGRANSHSSRTVRVMHVSVMQPSVIPVTQYSVVAVGEATGSGQSVQLRPVAGDHRKVSAPETCNWADVPMSITSGALT